MQIMNTREDMESEWTERRCFKAVSIKERRMREIFAFPHVAETSLQNWAQLRSWLQDHNLSNWICNSCIVQQAWDIKESKNGNRDQCSDHEIFTEIITDRLNKAMGTLIKDDLVGFMPGRQFKKGSLCCLGDRHMLEAAAALLWANKFRHWGREGY